MNKSKLRWLVPIGLCIFIFSGCGYNSQKNEKKADAATENVISEELHQAHCDLLAKANEQLAGINQKVRELNDKIHDKGIVFTDDQNATLDEFEKNQASINKRIHQIKNIKQEDWENFKINFETDLEEIKTAIDNMLSEL